MFRGKDVEEVIIPKSVTSIDNSAFNKCTNLTEITIPEGVIGVKPR